MQAYEGYIENGRFHPTGLLANIAGRRRAILTVLDEPLKMPVENNEKTFWSDFKNLIAQSADEELREEDFPRAHFGREIVDFTDGDERA